MEITMTTNPMRFYPPDRGQPVDAGHLEYLGKQAAALAETGSLSLSDAVVRMVGEEKLGSEQVRRVVEFANTEAFNRKFGALDPSNRVVDIEGGPADPQQVIQVLNNQARPNTVDLASMDYAMPPSAKVANDVDLGFGSASSERTRGGVMQDVVDLKWKLSTAHEETVQMAESSQLQMTESLQALQKTVKSAALDGLCREDLVSAWTEVDSGLLPTAMKYMPKLASRGRTKVGHRVNSAHPVVGGYREFVKHAARYATCTAARQNLERRLIEVDTFLSEHRS
jgi:hypothetical protein